MKDEGNPDRVTRTTEFALRIVRMFVSPQFPVVRLFIPASTSAPPDVLEKRHCLRLCSYRSFSRKWKPE